MKKRELFEKKYGLDRPEEPKTQQHVFSGDWGMSFRTEPTDSFDRLVHVVPFSPTATGLDLSFIRVK
ncbi:hypothetical protein Q0F98_03985 [Paenibacillus amylolyticus]|nr:hypothetical protein Q0F98_03985 [Paenibacillus amylolyticus]